MELVATLRAPFGATRLPSVLLPLPYGSDSAVRELCLIARSGGGFSVLRWHLNVGVSAVQPLTTIPYASSSNITVATSVVEAEEVVAPVVCAAAVSSDGWLLALSNTSRTTGNVKSGDVSSPCALMYVDAVAGATDSPTTVSLVHDAAALFVDARGRAWASSVAGAVTCLTQYGTRRDDISERRWRPVLACRLATPARILALSAAYIGESAALLPPCLLLAGGLPGAALHRALQEAASDVAAVADGHADAQQPRDDALQRLITLTTAGAVDAYVCPQPRPPIGAGTSAVDSQWPTRESLVRDVSGGLLSAVRSLRATQGGRALEAALGPSAAAWVPSWVSAALQPPLTENADHVSVEEREHSETLRRETTNGRPLVGSGGGSGGEHSAPIQQHHAPCEVDFTFPDAERSPRAIVASPDGLLLLLTDSSGRVTLLEAADLVILRVWKGYRDAQAAWVARRSGAGGACVAIFAPRRAAVEVWELHGDTPLAVLAVPPAAADGARLVAVNEAAAAGAPSGLLLLALPLAELPPAAPPAVQQEASADVDVRVYRLAA